MRNIMLTKTLFFSSWQPHRACACSTEFHRAASRASQHLPTAKTRDTHMPYRPPPWPPLPACLCLCLCLCRSSLT